MGLKIIYGKSGSGKSEYCYQQIAENIKNEEKIFLITPEQFSFTAEQKLMEKVKTEAVLQAEVIHLSRLAKRVISEIGIKDTRMTKCGKAMLISNILTTNKKQLKYLSKSEENIEIAISSITEFKKHGITVEKLKEQIEKTENPYLKTKLQDIAIIYEQYDAKIQANYIDEADELTILAQNIEKIEWIKNSVIYIDEFAGFTYPEYQVIKELIKHSKQVNITITTDTLEKPQNPDTDIFYANKLTVKRLINMAKENDLKLEEPIYLEAQPRFKTEELKHLEANLFKTKSTRNEQNVENISIFLAKNQYTEIENIAKEITKLVREKQMRYKDISIITKNIQNYANLAKVIFDKYDIPIFIDERRELSQNIIIQYVLSIFETLRKNYTQETIFQYVKMGFTKIPLEDIFKLEIYCTKWGIKQNKLKKDFTYELENKKEEITYLNELRKQIIEPLEELKRNIQKEKTAKGITTKLYEFLQKQEIEQQIISKMDNLEKEGKVDLVQEYKESYEILINILDEIVAIFGDDTITIDQYTNLLKQGLKASSLGKIPGTQDQVIMGDVDRSRSHKVETVFIIGLNDGVYPSINKNQGFFGDEERDYLKEQGIELAKGTLENLYDDNFNIYKAFTTAENDIYLSYISTDKEGKAKRPSTIITKIKKIFPKLKEKSEVLQENSNITTVAATFKELLLNIRKLRNNEEVEYIWKDVYNWYINNEQWKKKLSNIIKGFDSKKTAEKISEKNIKRLYGENLKTSISRLEQYRKCPFSFHLKYGLKLKEKEELKIKSIDTGIFMHDIIDTFFETIDNVKEITQEEIEKTVEEIINSKLELNKNYIFTSNPKFIVLTNRLKKVVIQSIKYIVLQIQNSDFEILGNEIEFKKKIDNVEIIGKIDRLDVAKADKAQYIRIIDYKSSDKNIDLNELVFGTQIQLITYLDSVVSEKENALPAGMLYFKMIDPIIKADRNKSEEQIKEELKKKFKMNGMILADINVIKKMDKNLEKGASNLIPVYLDKNGNISNSWSNVLTKEEFTKLQKTAEKIIKEIAKEILSGNIDIKPAYNRKTKIDACKYCEYKTICRFDPKVNHYAFINNKSKEEILETLKD